MRLQEAEVDCAGHDVPRAHAAGLIRANYLLEACVEEDSAARRRVVAPRLEIESKA